jgi:Flp pilus assembly protein TadG
MRRIGEKGVAAVEFALLLIPLILFLFGAIEFGLLMYDKQVLTNASREGARAGIVFAMPRVTPAAIQAVVTSYASTYMIGFPASAVTMDSPTGYDANAAFGTDLTITVHCTYNFLLLGNFIPGISPITLTATTVMRYE